MHDIKYLTSILGLTENQVRIRLSRFNSILDGHIKKGNHNRILIDNNGLVILQRIKELESQGLAFDQIQSTIETEMGRPQAEPSSTQTDSQTESNDKLIRHLEARITSLENQLKEKDKQIEWFQNILQSRVLQLAPAEEEIRAKLAKRANRWERFKQLIRGE